MEKQLIIVQVRQITNKEKLTNADLKQLIATLRTEKFEVYGILVLISKLRNNKVVKDNLKKEGWIKGSIEIPEELIKNKDRKYFYSNGIKEFGPFTLAELKENNLSWDTKIWYQGMEGWKIAAEVPEFKNYVPLPPPIPPPPIETEKKSSENVISVEPNSTANGTPPKTWLLESILVTLFCCLPFGIAGIVNASKVESKFYIGDTEGAQRASMNAKKWTKVSLIIGIVYWTLYTIIIIANT